MTIEEVKNLSDEELRIKVAELLGFENCGRYSQDGHIDEDGVFIAEGPIEENKYAILTGKLLDLKVRSAIPDYPKDLNAMREVEDDMLNGSSGWRMEEEYLTNLGKVIYGAKANRNDWSYNSMVFATARQRAEAFVLSS